MSVAGTCNSGVRIAWTVCCRPPVVLRMENAKLEAAFDCVFTLADTGEGLSSLSDLAADCHGEDADRLAACIRSAGLVEGVLVTSLAEDASEATVCAALSLLGNLLTDEYDVDAHQSLDLFESAGGLDALIALIRTLVQSVRRRSSHQPDAGDRCSAS